MKGCDYIRNVLVNAFQETDRPVFVMGAYYNDPKVLTAKLNAHPDAYVVVSASDGIWTCSGKKSERNESRYG